jgi:hypothetical protein
MNEAGIKVGLILELLDEGSTFFRNVVIQGPVRKPVVF